MPVFFVDPPQFCGLLGLAYIFYFNNPTFFFGYNPLTFLYHTMGILVICTIAHYYTVPHLTALTALKQLDREFESVSQSLKVPFYKTFTRVTFPVRLGHGLPTRGLQRRTQAWRAR